MLFGYWDWRLFRTTNLRAASTPPPHTAHHTPRNWPIATPPKPKEDGTRAPALETSACAYCLLPPMAAMAPSSVFTALWKPPTRKCF